MRGTDSKTGKALAGLDHLRQSVRDILTTPIGSRVMRRDYGSQLFSLIDAPLNRSTLMDIYAASADALSRWEPRIQVTSYKAAMPEPGALTLDITGIHLPSGEPVLIDGIVIR